MTKPTYDELLDALDHIYKVCGSPSCYPTERSMLNRIEAVSRNIVKRAEQKK